MGIKKSRHIYIQRVLKIKRIIATLKEKDEVIDQSLKMQFKRVGCIVQRRQREINNGITANCTRGREKLCVSKNNESQGDLPVSRIERNKKKNCATSAKVFLSLTNLFCNIKSLFNIKRKKFSF